MDLIYYFSFFFLNLPPLFIFSQIITSHILAKLILLSLLIYFVLKTLCSKEKIKTIQYKNQNFFILIGIYIISQSISILPAGNIVSFLAKFEDIFFGLVFLLDTEFLLKKKGERVFKTAINVLLAACFFNFLTQLVIFLWPSSISSLSRFVHSGYINTILLNLQRGRTYLETYNEVLLPFIMYFLYLNKGLKFYYFCLLAIGIIYFSIISGFRTSLLMVVVSLGGFYIFIKTKKKMMLSPVLVLLTIVIMLIANFAPNPLSYERLINTATNEDLTFWGRINRYTTAINMGIKAPFFGVGLGNYYDNLNYFDKKSSSLIRKTKNEYELAAFYPHNIFFETFAESGSLGLLSFSLLILYFIFEDLKTLFKRRQRDLVKLAIISFWTLFLYSLFNPVNNITYLTLFWFFRTNIFYSTQHRLHNNR